TVDGGLTTGPATQLTSCAASGRAAVPPCGRCLRTSAAMTWAASLRMAAALGHSLRPHLIQAERPASSASPAPVPAFPLGSPPVFGARTPGNAAVAEIRTMKSGIHPIY